MSNNPYRHNNSEIRELLMQYLKMKAGKGFTFIEEEGFEQIADYYIQKDQFQDALEAADVQRIIAIANDAAPRLSTMVTGVLEADVARNG